MSDQPKPRTQKVTLSLGQWYVGGIMLFFGFVTAAALPLYVAAVLLAANSSGLFDRPAAAQEVVEDSREARLIRKLASPSGFLNTEEEDFLWNRYSSQVMPLAREGMVDWLVRREWLDGMQIFDKWREKYGQ